MLHWEVGPTSLKAEPNLFGEKFVTIPWSTKLWEQVQQIAQHSPHSKLPHLTGVGKIKEIVLKWLSCAQTKFFFLFSKKSNFHMAYFRHMEVPRLGVESELQLPAYTITTAMRDASESANYTPAHSNAGSPTSKQGQRSNPQPHGT